MIVGIDYDTYKATLCALPGDDRAPIFAEARYRKTSQSGDDASYEALGRVDGTLNFAMLDILRKCDDPFAAFIERGYGASRRADFWLGAYLAALVTARTWRDVGAGRPNLMQLQEWKRAVTAATGIGLTVKGAGNGQAKKEVANEACRALLARHWPDKKYLLSADQLDAFGIAYTADQLNTAALERKD